MELTKHSVKGVGSMVEELKQRAEVDRQGEAGEKSA